MKAAIPYLDKQLPLEFPSENLLAVAEPNEYRTDMTAEELIAAALAAPYGPAGTPADAEAAKGRGAGLAEFVRGGKRLLVIINDATRPTPTETILTGLLPAVEAAAPGRALTLMVATGAHRAATENEYRQILGRHYAALRECCVCHDARNDADMVDIGATRNGTPMLLNRRLFEADRIIATGSVEPHYFAGFTGGRKAFLPGIAAYKTVEANHKLALSPAARSLALDG
ncbi:MAG: lactate racemase domain-containing protein, partial [Treponema sp.]|nr:lactate racemase domain-containing protein [Treponema sp.]